MENKQRMPGYTLVGRINATIAKKAHIKAGYIYISNCNRSQFLSKETILGSENSRTQKEIGCHPFGSGMGGSEAHPQR